MEEFKLIPNHEEFEVSENGKIKEIATGKIKRARIDKETGDRHIKLDDEDININKLVDELFKVEEDKVEIEKEVKEEVLVKEKPMEDEVNKNMTIEVAKEDENDIENMNNTKVQHNPLYNLLFN
jgi:hypothetical protein